MLFFEHDKHWILIKSLVGEKMKGNNIMGKKWH